MKHEGGASARRRPGRQRSRRRRESTGPPRGGGCDQVRRRQPPGPPRAPLRGADQLKPTTGRRGLAGGPPTPLARQPGRRRWWWWRSRRVAGMGGRETGPSGGRPVARGRGGEHLGELGGGPPPRVEPRWRSWSVRCGSADWPGPWRRGSPVLASTQERAGNGQENERARL